MAEEIDEDSQLQQDPSRGGPVKLTTIRTLSSFEANLAAAKLESVGVRAFVADQNANVMYPIVFANVRLQVAKRDVERAEQILRAPVTLEDENESDGAVAPAAAEAGTDGYAEETYRCPRCHRKPVDLVPLSPAMRGTRVGCLVLLAVPLIVVVVESIAPIAGGGSLFNYVPPGGFWAWIVVIAVLSLIVLLTRRVKRCRECGHEWTDATTATDDASS